MGLFGKTKKKTKRASNKKAKDQVWEKASKVKGENPKVYRKDAYGNKIRKSSYGTNGKYSWEVDHKKPLSKGGSNESKNLQALHKTENRKKSDSYPYKPAKHAKESLKNIFER